MSCVGDRSPQVDDEVVGEPKGLQVRVVDSLGEIHRIGLVAAQIPNLNRELVVVDAEKWIEQNVDGVDAALRNIVVLKVDNWLSAIDQAVGDPSSYFILNGSISICLESQRLLSTAEAFFARHLVTSTRRYRLESALHRLHQTHGEGCS